MAAQTIMLCSSNGCVATLNWNDTTDTATSVTVDNTHGSLPATFQITTSAFQSTIVQPGNTNTITFPIARAITIGVSTGGTQTLKGLVSYGLSG